MDDFKKDIKFIKKSLNSIKAEFSLGKKGVTNEFIDSIKKYLKARGVVKIKVPIAKNSSEVKGFAKLVSEEVGAELVEVKGFTFSLAILDSLKE